VAPEVPRAPASAIATAAAAIAMRGAAVVVAAAKTTLRRDEVQEQQIILVERTLRDARSDEDGLGIKGASDELLRGLLTAAMLAQDKRFAAGTRRVDKSYWKFWKSWCDMVGTPPLRTNEAANNGTLPSLHRREVANAVGCFMSWATEAELRGWKIESMLARLRGVARRHWAVGIRFVSLAAVVLAADGLIQEHIDAHGYESLQSKPKEPFTTTEIIAMLQLPPGTVIHGDLVVGDNLEWQGMVVLICLNATGGFRKEAVALGKDEKIGARKLKLSDIVYRFSGVITKEPTVEMLRTMRDGDMAWILPVCCKNDPTNKKFGGTPVPSRYHSTRPICFAREVAKYEIMRRWTQEANGIVEPRSRQLLIVGPGREPWTKRGLDGAFGKVLRTVCDEGRAQRLSLHSFRTWLACALLAAGATADQIMVMCRWSSESARRLYSRITDSKQDALREAGEAATIDVMRTATLTAALDSAVTRTGMLETATEAGAPTATVDELRRRGCVVDDDGAHAIVHQSIESLKSMAERSETAIGHEVDSASDEEDLV